MKAKHSGNGEIIYVGKKCVVCCSESSMVAGDSRVAFLEQGRIALYKRGPNDPLEAQITEAPSYSIQCILKGRRDDAVPVSDPFQDPVPEIQLLVALLSESPLERFHALSNFMEQRQKMANQVLEGLKMVILAYEEVSLNALAMSQDEECAGDSYPVVFDLEPELFGYFVGRWMVILTENNRISELSSWRKAAQKIIASRADIHSAKKSAEQNDDSDDKAHLRVFAAIKNAALDCAGLPHQQMIRDFLEKDGGTEIPSEQVRSVLATLGFSWIPGKPDWTKLWLPKSPKGWN